MGLIRERFQLKGVDPSYHEQGAFTDTEFVGMYGFYAPETGRFAKLSRFETYSSIALGTCVGVEFGDGEEDFLQGVLAVDLRRAKELIDDKAHLAELSAHVNYQVNEVPDAMYSGLIRMSEAGSPAAQVVRKALYDLSSPA